MTSAGKPLLVVNPTAGSGRAGREWHRLKDQAGGRAELLLAPDAETTRSGIARAIAAGTRRVIGFGGDGTANLVISSLLAEGRGDVEFAVVPAGTASDFARDVGLPRDPAKALELALTSRKTRAIDAVALRFETGKTRYSLNVASAGVSGKVDEAHRDKSSGYLMATIKTLLAYQPKSCRIEVDGRPFYDGEFFLIAMANARYFGKGMKVAPHAILDDGLIDVVLIHVLPLWHLPLRLPQFLFGWHSGSSVVKETRARQLRLFPGPDFPPYDLDGEALPSENVTVEILPGALRLAV
jgi:diacylglycerol kinase (ATP)